MKTLLKVNRFENATASVSVCTPKTHCLQNDDVTVALSFHAVIQNGGRKQCFVASVEFDSVFTV